MRALPALGVLACSAPTGGALTEPNVLLVVVDDVSAWEIGAYGDPDATPTPRLDALAAEGVRFDRAYADPLCSATRAGLLTGRHAFRYGIGSFLGVQQEWSLPAHEATLPEVLEGYDAAAVGKLHLGGTRDARPSTAFAPDLGFDAYQGAPANLGARLYDGTTEDYFHYDRIGSDGWWHLTDGYATIDVTDTALAALGEVTEPWLLHVGYHGGHAPFHAPPDSVNPSGVAADAPVPDLYDGMIASVDQEIGRLLDGIDAATWAHTLVIVIGDNGTPPEATEGAREGLPSKGTVYEGGTRVPLIVAGGAVGGRGSTDALVSHVDVFATVVDLAGDVRTSALPLDGATFAPLLDDPGAPGVRDHVYAETFEPNGPGPYEPGWQRMARGERYKLIRVDGEPDRLFDLDADPLEQHDLASGPMRPEEQAAFEALALAMAGYPEPVVASGPTR